MANINRTTYDYLQDSADGWVKVSLAELRALEVDDLLSPTSRQWGDNVYIHDDQDLNYFKRAKERIGVTLNLKKKYTTKSSKVRSYGPYLYREPK